MINYFTYLSFFFLTFRPDGGMDEVRRQLEQQNKKLHEALVTKNVDLLDEVYHPDAYFMAPGDTIVHGIKKIKAKWKAGMKVTVDMRSVTREITGKGDVVSEVGTVETSIKTKDTAFVYKAKYNNVWQKDAKGKYKLKVDIWNALP